MEEQLEAWKGAAKPGLLLSPTAALKESLETARAMDCGGNYLESLTSNGHYGSMVIGYLAVCIDGMTLGQGQNGSSDANDNPGQKSGLSMTLTSSQVVLLLSAFIITILLWLLGSYLVDTRFSLLAEPLRDIALLVGSLGFFESLKDFLLQQDNKDQKKELLDQAITRFSRELDADNLIRSAGVRGVRSSFDISALRKLILDLQPGDAIYCHDGSIPDFSKLSSIIVSKAINGVHFRFIALAPYCKNAVRRAEELNEDVEFYSESCKMFAHAIEGIRRDLANHATAMGLSRQEVMNRVQLKLYRSLMSIPFYLVFKNSQPVVAITGFYLCKASSSAIHIDWEDPTVYENTFSMVDPRGQSRISDDNSFLTTLWDYWRFKWEKGCDEYDRTKRLEGMWTYQSKTLDDQPVYEGFCEITEVAGSLRAKGTRTQTYTADGSKLETRIEWSTNVMHKYTQDGNLCLITSHDCFPQCGPLVTTGVKAFMLLTFQSKALATVSEVLAADGQQNPMSDQQDAQSCEHQLTLEGTFFVTGKPEDALFQARTGKVLFFRTVNHDPHQSPA